MRFCVSGFMPLNCVVSGGHFRSFASAPIAVSRFQAGPVRMVADHLRSKPHAW